MKKLLGHIETLGLIVANLCGIALMATTLICLLLIPIVGVMGK